MQIPSELDQAETACRPWVFRGLVADWPALQHWAGATGVAYLRGKAGGAGVQAMYSAQGPHFAGNIEAHEPLSCCLADLLELAERQQQHDSCSGDGGDGTANGAANGGGAPRHLPHVYLAQQEMRPGSGLDALLEDAPAPALLGDRQVSQTNLWMSIGASESSTHYDVYQNLLCVVTGGKRVTLYPPAATPGMYPRPVHGESANHSSVASAHTQQPQEQQPLWGAQPLFAHAQVQALVVRLGPGDALFIPEGWWHQVASESLTIAVNFWWPSRAAAALLAAPHMAHYQLRVLLAGLGADHRDQLLASVAPLQLPSGGAAAPWRVATPTAGASAAGTRPRSCSSSPEPSKRPRKGPAPGQDPQQEAQQQLQAAAAARGQEQAAAREQLSATERWALDVMLAEAAGGAAPSAADAEQDGGADANGTSSPGAASAGVAGAAGVADATAGDVCAADEGWERRARRAQRAMTRAVVGQHLGDGGAAAAPPGGAPAAGSDAGASARQPGATAAAAAADPLGLSHPVTRLLVTLAAPQLLNVLYVLGTEHSAAARQLMLQALTPAGAEVLTQRLEQAEGAGLFGEPAAEVAGGEAAGGGGLSAAGEPSFSAWAPPERALLASARSGSGALAADVAARAGPGGGGAGGSGAGRAEAAGAGALVFDGREQFYCGLYGGCGPPEAVMARLLALKSQLSGAVHQAVVGAVLGR